MSNVNLKTGIRFGVISARSVPDLEDTIITSGDNLTYNAWRSGLVDELQSAMSDAQGGDISTLVGFIRENAPYYVRNEAGTRVEKILADQDGSELSKYDAGDILDSLNICENYENDGDEYSYTDSDGNQFLMSQLGGANLIWCIFSNRIVKVDSLCSPCVPNAGDLDTDEDEDGYECYGLPEQWKESKETD